MNFRLRIPRFGSSSVETGTRHATPVLDGRDVIVPNRWGLPAHTVALIGRPAVLVALSLGPVHLEQDFGGHLFIAITGEDASRVTLVEAGPLRENGSGNLVPFAYPEDALAERGDIDFPPIVIAPPNGLTENEFSELVRSTQRCYDGDQRYVAIEIPFLRVGRDSNSYAVAALLCSGVDVRAVPRPRDVKHYEWSGYPGMEDPVHGANFGIYMGAPTQLGNGIVDVAYHNDDGSVRFVVVGGEPNGRAQLPDGTLVDLDALGRIVLMPKAAAQHKLPSAKTSPPPNIAQRRRFPTDPDPGGGLLTFIVDGRSVPLEPGKTFRGRVIDRHAALRVATISSDHGEIVIPLDGLGFELRDPKRVDALFRVGNELTVGLRRDRHPRLVAHGPLFFIDRLTLRQFHAPRPINVVTTFGVLAVLGALAVVWKRRA